jgi:hypothetical protein
MTISKIADDISAQVDAAAATAAEAEG